MMIDKITGNDDKIHNRYNEPKWLEPVEYILIGFDLGVIFTIFIYGGYLL